MNFNSRRYLPLEFQANLKIKEALRNSVVLRLKNAWASPREVVTFLFLDSRLRDSVLIDPSWNHRAFILISGPSMHDLGGHWTTLQGNSVLSFPKPLASSSEPGRSMLRWGRCQTSDSWMLCHSSIGEECLARMVLSWEDRGTFGAAIYSVADSS